jgi:2-hydroxycyclohexanecarboxyl-CoA dehydrogenase
MSSERVAFVTGGAGGIGSEICRQLAAAGHRVAVADLAGSKTREVASAIGGRAIDLDVTDAASVERAARDAAAALGPIDVCVNCAGWDELMPFVSTDEAFLRRVLEINLAGAIRVCRALVPGMIERKWGRVINIASDAGRVGSTNEAIYSGAKGGLIAFTKTLARETARYGVTANAVCPGPTATPLLEAVTGTGEAGQKVIDAMVRSVPMRRIGQPADIAPAVVFFASEGAGFVTGQTLSVSGGLTMAG